MNNRILFYARSQAIDTLYGDKESLDGACLCNAELQQAIINESDAADPLPIVVDDAQFAYVRALIDANVQPIVACAEI